MSETKILVVEDEVITSEVIAEQLELLGYTVTDTVGSGNKAIASVAKTQPNLVLMDINLKGNMDGIATAAHIWEQFKIPVVYLTAHSDEATLQRAKVTEAFGYIVKPFNDRDLRIAIEMALSKHLVERQLAEREQMLSSILNSTSDAVVATNETGAITYMNPAAETLTGWSVTDATGQKVTEVLQFVHETTGEAGENPATRVLQEGRVLYLDEQMALIAKDGTTTPVADSASPIFQDTGDITGAVLVLCDMSDRRQIQALEKEVIETQQSEAEVRQTLEAERELGELKSRLITTISHEYRTPLAVILGSSEMLQQYSHKLSEEKKQKHLERIQGAVEHMKTLVENVLTFGKAEAGKLEFNPAPLNVETFCRNLLEEQQMVAGGCTLNFTYQGNRDSVYLDAQLLQHILSNLLSNAVKYSPKGSTVSLNACCEDDRVIFCVQDQGIGIPLSEQQRLFQPFFRASNIGNIGGTGMGLAIVKKCVDAHGGQITVESEVGVGTTFTVKLPLNRISTREQGKL